MAYLGAGIVNVLMRAASEGHGQSMIPYLMVHTACHTVRTISKRWQRFAAVVRRRQVGRSWRWLPFLCSRRPANDAEINADHSALTSCPSSLTSVCSTCLKCSVLFLHSNYTSITMETPLCHMALFQRTLDPASQMF